LTISPSFIQQKKKYAFKADKICFNRNKVFTFLFIDDPEGDDDSSQKSVVFETLPFGDKAHTGLNISEQLRRVFKQYNITNKVTAIIADNASNQQLAIRLLELPSFPCTVHTLQLAMKAGLEVPEIDALLKKFQEIIKRIKKSSPLLSCLHKVRFS
jgi:hypothetical protein